MALVQITHTSQHNESLIISRCMLFNVLIILPTLKFIAVPCVVTFFMDMVELDPCTKIDKPLVVYRFSKVHNRGAYIMIQS